jgi:flagellar protein FlaF
MSSSNASTQYRQPAQQGGSPRETEGRALMEAARRLSVAKENPGDKAALVDTVRLNWRLWTIFQSDLSEPDNALPEELRNNMLTLCNYVDKRTVEILSSPNPESLDVLININRNIASGLLADPNSADQTGDAAAAGPVQSSSGGFTA